MQLNCFYICSMKSIKSIKSDQWGIIASIGCAIHCAVLPLIITTLPLLGLEFLANIWVEIIMICISLLVGVYALSGSYPKHKKGLPVLILIFGFLIIAAGHLVFENIEAILVPIGGLTIAAAHLINWHYTKQCVHG